MIELPIIEAPLNDKPLADDLLNGASEAAAFVFGDPAKRRRIYHMTEAGVLPVIRMGQRLYYRKSALLAAFGSGEPIVPVECALLEATVQPTPRPVKLLDPRPTFADLYPLFAELFEPRPERMTALLARARNYIRLGAAKSGHVGAGRAARFALEDVWQLLVLMELNDLGVPPEKGLASWTSNPQLALSQVVREMDEHGGVRCITTRNGSYVVINAQRLHEAARRCFPNLEGW